MKGMIEDEKGLWQTEGAMQAWFKDRREARGDTWDASRWAAELHEWVAKGLVRERVDEVGRKWYQPGG